jgi:hypothetical protein
MNQFQVGYIAVISAWRIRWSVKDHLAGGHLDRGGAGVVSEPGRRPEPANGTDMSKDLAGGQCA